MSTPLHKPTLRYVCTRHGIVSALALWRESGVDPLVAWDALTGEAISEREASQIVGAINTLKGTSYTLAEIAVRLVETPVKGR